MACKRNLILRGEDSNVATAISLLTREHKIRLRVVHLDGLQGRVRQVSRTPKYGALVASVFLLVKYVDDVEGRVLHAPPRCVIQIKRVVYNPCMAVFSYGREYYEKGEYVRRSDASPGNNLDPVVRIVEDLGTVEVPCGKVDCRANCLEYLVHPARARKSYALTECKISPLVNVI